MPLGDGGVALVCAFVALGAVALGAAAGALEAAARDIQSRADTLWLTPRGAELALRAAEKPPSQLQLRVPSPGYQAVLDDIVLVGAVGPR